MKREMNHNWNMKFDLLMKIELSLTRMKIESIKKKRKIDMNIECSICQERNKDCSCERQLLNYNFIQDLQEVPSSFEEKIHHPQHYRGNTLEVIDIIEDFNLNFCLGNSVKYILRAGKKGNKNEDLQKAIWYLQREVRNEAPA